MTPIAGIVRLDRSSAAMPLLAPLLERMCPKTGATMDTWAEGAVGLGCLGFSDKDTVNFSGSVAVCENHVLVFDGRIDNREELARALPTAGRSVAHRSDQGLVLAAYDTWGEECAAKLLGDFAFALWDRRLQRLFCVRDPVGAKPFYYYCSDSLFAFASDDEALIGLPGVSRRPSEELAAFFLVREFQDVRPDQAWVQEARLLLPAHSLSVTPDGVKEPRRYWRFEPGSMLGCTSREEYAEAFRQVFAEAVRCRRGDVSTPAAMLSGGMDSAALAATLSRQVSAGSLAGFHTFSAVADDIESSLESRCIRSLTSRPYIHAHSWQVPSLQGTVGLADLKAAAWQNAHPISNAILIPAMMCLAARRGGQFNLLYAAAGDVAIGDYPRYIAHLLRRGRWLAAWQECRQAAINNTHLRAFSKWQLLLQNTRTAFLPHGVQRWVRGWLSSASEAPANLSLLNPDFVRRLALPARIEARREGLRSLSALDFASSHARLAFGPYSAVAAGLTGCQRVATRYGVETSDPWADRRVLEFLARVPLEWRVRDGWTKHLARSAFATDLKAWVVWRNDKDHLGWSVVESLLRQSREEMDAFTESGVEAIGDILDVASVRRLRARCLEAGNAIDLSTFFDVMTLGLWVSRLEAQGRAAAAD